MSSAVRLPDGPMGDIIWLASYPKSGTTWLRAFLHNYLRNAREPYDINRLADLTASENDARLYRPYDPRPASEFTRADVRRMRPLVHRDLTGAFPDFVFVKTHNAFVKEEGVSLITPAVTAGAIYLVRDPRDVALSYSAHLGYPLDRVIEMMAAEGAVTGGDDAHVYERLGSWSSHVASWTRAPNPRLLVLRYEDLHEQPAQAFGHVIAFLGGVPAPERLERAIELSRFGRLKAQEEAAGFIERPARAAAFFRSGRVGEWRTALSPAQSARIERDHGQQMTRFGYIPSGDQCGRSTSAAAASIE